MFDKQQWLISLVRTQYFLLTFIFFVWKGIQCLSAFVFVFFKCFFVTINDAADATEDEIIVGRFENVWYLFFSHNSIIWYFSNKTVRNWKVNFSGGPSSKSDEEIHWQKYPLCHIFKGGWPAVFSYPRDGLCMALRYVKILSLSLQI